MRLEITGRNFPITPAARRLIERGIAHTLKLLPGSVVSTHVVLARQRGQVRAEVTVHVSREHFLHSEGSGADVQVALAAAIDKIEHQVDKLKGKWARRKRGERPTPVAAASDGASGAARTTGEEPGRRIIKARRYAVKPMSIEDAAAEIGDGSDAVIVFRNSSTDAVTVLFRRADGNLGLIEPDA